MCIRDSHIAMAARTRQVAPVGHTQPIRRALDDCSDLVAGPHIELHLEQGVPLVLEKTASVANTHDHAQSSAAESAVKTLQRSAGFRNLLTVHEQRWGQNWDRFAVRIDLAEHYAHQRRSTAQLAPGQEFQNPEFTAGVSRSVGSAAEMGKDLSLIHI